MEYVMISNGYSLWYQSNIINGAGCLYLVVV